MRLLLFAMVLLCAACPAPRHALSIEVRSGGQPLGSAVVALVCKPEGSAQLTDEIGRAVFEIPEDQPLDRCRLMAGKVGFRTVEVEAQPGRACAERARCAVVPLELVEQGDTAPEVPSSPSPSPSPLPPPGVAP